MSGNGDGSFQVLLLRSRKSTTVRNIGGWVPGFGMSNIGTVFLADEMIHRPVLTYASLFSAHCSRNTSGHLDGHHVYVFSMSINGIVWLMSRWIGLRVIKRTVTGQSEMMMMNVTLQTVTI